VRGARTHPNPQLLRSRHVLVDTTKDENGQRKPHS